MGLMSWPNGMSSNVMTIMTQPISIPVTMENSLRYQTKCSVVVPNDHILPQFVKVPLVLDRNCFFLWEEAFRCILDVT